jgi:hypothetical protein
LGVRALASLLLLLAQLPPLVGVVLCQGLARTEAELMEDGCPMPDTGGARLAPQADVSAISITSPSPTHGCVFAEAALASPLAVIPAAIAFGTLPPSSAVFQPAAVLHGAEALAPPIPPPNL